MADKPVNTPLQPEAPEVLLRRATTYLVNEVDRLSALAEDAVKCGSPFSAGVLVRELDNRLHHYRDGGLQALVNIVDKVLTNVDKS